VPTSREIQLAARPQGWPTPDCFRLVEVELPEPGPGQVLVRNLVMSVDPYMRGRMNDVKSYIAPFRLDAPLDGGAVGEVVRSDSPDLQPGDVVLHGYGWRELVVADAARFRVVDTALAPASAYLGLLGMPALTAYAGLLEVAAMRPGDTVFVSGAAGAVGSMAGQIARLRGATRVIGSAGSDAKVRYLLDELGFDAAFNYRAAPVRDQLRIAAPEGIDVYFDNVGGDHLEAAIGALRRGGRVALCGAIAQYNAEAPTPGPANLALAIGKRLTLRGFIVNDFDPLQPQFLDEARQWLADGRFRCDETVVDGLEHAPTAFLDLLRGANTGKMLVRLADPAA
jgi:NADPH-dependent curcumin reductase CurA